jgi:hypothetical protein
MRGMPMEISTENGIMAVFSLINILIIVFIIEWTYFREWIVVFLFKCVVDFVWGSAVVSLKMIEYPVRLLPKYYETCIFFEIWIFPALCVWYNQVTREQGLRGILMYSLLFSAGITAIEYPIEKYTDLIRYIDWTWFTTFYTLNITFLLSRSFMAFYRWGCNYFGKD